MPIIMFPDGGFLVHCTYVPIVNFDYLGECSHLILFVCGDKETIAVRPRN